MWERGGVYVCMCVCVCGVLKSMQGRETARSRWMTLDPEKERDPRARSTWSCPCLCCPFSSNQTPADWETHRRPGATKQVAL